MAHFLPKYPRCRRAIIARTKSTSLAGSLFYGAPKGDQSLFLGFFAQMAEISGPKPALSAIHSFRSRDQTCSHFHVVPPLAPYHTRRPLMAVCLGKLDACNPIEIRRLDLCNGRMGTLIVKKIVFCFFFQTMRLGTLRFSNKRHWNVFRFQYFSEIFEAQGSG